MLLNEIFAKDLDLTDHQEKILTAIKDSPEGLNIKALFKQQENINDTNLATAKQSLIKLGLIEELPDKQNFYKLTDAGEEALERDTLSPSDGKEDQAFDPGTKPVPPTEPTEIGDELPL